MLSTSISSVCFQSCVFQQGRAVDFEKVDRSMQGLLLHQIEKKNVGIQVSSFTA